MYSILAIDPGPERSAYCSLSPDRALLAFGILPNMEVLELIRHDSANQIVCERVRSFGMPAGRELFETCEWCGRFCQVAVTAGIAWYWLTRLDVKVALCGTAKAKDPNIRAALMDRYGGVASVKKGGSLHGVSKDVWSSLAVAVVWQDRQKAEINGTRDAE